MANPQSPGVYVNVFDFSQFAPQAGVTTLCVVGGASSGPVGKPMMFTSAAALIAVFGQPVLTDYGIQTAIQFLKQGSQVIYCRVAHNSLAATVPIPGLNEGTPAVAATGSLYFNSSDQPADADLVKVRNQIPELLLNNANVGASGNQALTFSSSAIAVTGMSGGTVSSRASGTVSFIGGANPATNDTLTINDGATTKVFQFTNGSPSGSNIKVAIGADGYATMSNLLTAINGAGFNVAAAQDWTEVVFEFDSNNSVGAGHIAVLIGSSSSATLLNLISAINLSTSVLGIVATNATVTVPALNLTALTGGTLYNGPVTTTGSVAVAAGMAGGANAIAGSVVNVMTVSALNPGTAGNDYQVVFAASATIGAPSGNFDMTVMAPVDSSGTLGIVEVFRNASLNPADPRFITTQVLSGIPNEVNPSQYVSIDVLADLGTVAYATYALGTGGGTVGTDGISGLVYSDYIGTISGQTATGLQAVRNPEKVQFNVLAVPGISDQRVIAAAQAVVEFRNDAMYIVDPPFGASVQQVTDWSNGLSDVFAESPTQPLDSRFLALYWSWVKVFDTYNNVEVWVPPSGPCSAAWANSDTISGPMISPAGPINGLVLGDAVEYSPDQDDRNILEGYQNCVNAIIDASQGGLMIFGDKTMQRAASSLIYLSVQRNLLYAQALCKIAVQSMLFKPNDPQTWLKIKGLVNPILDNIKNLQGWSTFVVVCDKTTNPDSQINQGVLRLQIKIAPILPANEIVMDFAIYASGVTLTQ